MNLENREKQIRAWAFQQGIFDSCSEEYIVEKIQQEVDTNLSGLSSNKTLGNIFALLIILANKKGLTLEECLCYNVHSIQQEFLKGSRPTLCHQCFNPNCFDDGK